MALHRTAQFVERWIWRRDADETTTFHRGLIRGARIAYKVGQDVRQGQLTLRAMSLVYTTILSLIPLLAISFSVLKGFGVHRELEPFLITYLAPLGERADELANHLISFIDNTNVTVLGYLGLALLFYAIVSLLQKVEQAFNYIWRVTVNRSFTERLRDYLVLVLVGPALMFTATGIWATILGTNVMEYLGEIQPFGWLLGGITRLLPFLIVIVAFSFVYVFIPNVKVRWRPAFAGAVVAGVLWNLGGYAFAFFVGHTSNYPAIYSSFATAIFFMIWLYLGWTILFIGGSISFYAQNHAFTSQLHDPAALSSRLKEKLALSVAAAIGRCFYSDEKAHTVHSLAASLRLPVYAVESVLRALESCRILTRAGRDGMSYVPAHDWASVSVDDLLNSVRRHGEVPGLSADDVNDPQIADAWQRIESAERGGDLTLQEISHYRGAAEPNDVDLPDRPLVKTINQRHGRA